MNLIMSLRRKVTLRACVVFSCIVLLLNAHQKALQKREQRKMKVHMTKGPTQPEYIHHSQKWKAFMSRVNPVFCLSMNYMSSTAALPSTTYSYSEASHTTQCNLHVISSQTSLKTSTSNRLYSCTLCY